MAPQQPQDQQPQDQGNLGAVVAALIAAGATAQALGVPPGASGAAAAADAKLAGLSASTIAELTKQILGNVRAFADARIVKQTAALSDFLEKQYPERKQSILDELAREEAGREREFHRRMYARLERDLPPALKIGDADARRAAVAKLLEREQRYLALREEAMHSRSIAAVERLGVKEASAKGAFWKLSPYVKEHTPDCLAMGDRFWPWPVLDAFNPPTHPGCRCMLLTEDEAVERGYMDHEHANVDVKDALTRARHAMRLAGKLHEAGLTETELALYVLELIEQRVAELEEAAEHNGGMVALYPDPQSAGMLAVPGGEPADTLHVTLKFLGPDHRALDHKELAAAVAKFAAGEQPLDAVTDGVGSFAAGDDGVPVFARIDAPGIEEFRQRLVDTLGDLAPADTYPDYKPHLTLKYAGEGEKLADPPRLPLRFTHVHLVLGGKHHSYELGSGAFAPGGTFVGRGPTLISEAHVSLRFPAGTHEGGQFRSAGEVGHPISAVKRALLAELIPELPRVPRARRHSGREVVLHGRRVHVPEQRRFDRTIAGHRYVSPVGSTNLYRDGSLYQPPARSALEGKLGLPLLQKATPAFEAGRLNSTRAEVDDRIANALQARRADLPPVVIGQSGWATDDRLREAGFLEMDYRDTTRGLEFDYAAPDGSSTMSVTYDKNGSKVAGVVWRPVEPKEAGPELRRPPKTWDDFRADVDAYARHIAGLHGRHAFLGDINVSDDPTYSDHVAEHHWTGGVDVASAIRDDILTAAATRARGGELTDRQKSRVYMSYQAAIHEALHAANPISRGDFDLTGMVLEEALTEELAHNETLRHLRSQGQTDVAQWAVDHPTHPARLGTYLAYRAALDDVLNMAKVAPEEREQAIAELKLDVRPQDRFAAVAALVGEAQGWNRDKALDWVQRRLVERGRPSASDSFDPTIDFSFAPIIGTDGTPTPDAELPYTIAGEPLRVGDAVRVRRRQHLHGKKWKTWEDYGVITGLRGDKNDWLADVKYVSDLKTEYGVLPRQIVGASEPDDPGLRLSFGNSSRRVRANGHTIHEGDLIRYDGRADNGYSQARVTRILRTSNPQQPNDRNAWAIEAVTTENSLRPATTVILTQNRVGNTIEPVNTGPHAPGGEGAPPVPLTLERKAGLSRAFELVKGAKLVDLARVVARSQPRPSTLEMAVQAFSDPAGGLREPPLPAMLRSDGRVDVLERPELVHAAERAGLGAVPVQLSGVSRADVVHELMRMRAHADHGESLPWEDGKRAGLDAAMELVSGGGGQRELLDAAVEHGDLHPADGTFDDGFQTALRSAWLEIETQHQARQLEVFGRRQSSGGMVRPVDAGPDYSRRPATTSSLDELELARHLRQRQENQGSQENQVDWARLNDGRGPVARFTTSGDAVGQEYHGVIVALDSDGKPMGALRYAYVGKDEPLYLLDIEVAPDSRRQGVARALYERLRAEQPEMPVQAFGDVSTPAGRSWARSVGLDLGRASSGVGAIGLSREEALAALGLTAEQVAAMPKWRQRQHRQFLASDDQIRAAIADAEAFGHTDRVAALEALLKGGQAHDKLGFESFMAKLPGLDQILGNDVQEPVKFDPAKLKRSWDKVRVVDATGAEYEASGAKGDVEHGATVIRLVPIVNGVPKPDEKLDVDAADLPPSLVLKGRTQTPKAPVVVDPKKLIGGELVRDEAGKTWKVHLTGTQEEPTVTLESPDGDRLEYPESGLPHLELTQGAGGHSKSAWKPLPPPKPVWDDSHTVQLKEGAGGSNGARFAYTEGGQKWLVKQYSGDADRVATELLSNSIYRKLGVPVPEAGELHVGGKLALGYPVVEGEPGGYKLRIPKPSRALGKDFMVDALLANWDVVGLGHDNLLWPEGTTPEAWTPDTPATRLDQGGTLQFRAQGQKKPFGPVPTEVWTMASAKGGQAFGTMAVDQAAKRAGARKIAKVLTPQAIDELVDAAPFTDETMRGEVRDALKARVAWMLDFARGTVGEPAPLEGKDAVDALTTAQASLHLYPEQDVALRAWADGWDAVVNDHLRSGAPKEAAAKEVKFLTRELDSITAHQRLKNDTVAYFGIPGDPANAPQLVDKALVDKGFLAVSVDPGTAQHAVASGGVMVRVLLPETTKALYLRGVPGLDVAPAGADLLLARGARVRVLRVLDDGTLDGVLIP